MAGSAVVVVVAAIAASQLLGGCAPSHHPARQARHAAAPHRVRGPLTSPFTGRRIPYLRRVLVFKIDNVPQARPPTGLAKADIVYLLPVEGGLSRIFAVFSSRIPRVVGPVRSTRKEDIKLLNQFGRPAFAFSGAQPGLLPVVEHSRIVNLYAGKYYGDYFRSFNRAAPYNLYARARVLFGVAQARHASKARDIGFRFGPAPPGGRPTRSYFVHYPAARFRFVWSRRQHRWLVWMDGARSYDSGGPRLGGATVVIQYVRVTRSVFLELGHRPPYANTVGHGHAVVLRDGRAWRVHWSRPDKNGGTAYRLPDGHRMLFAPGQVWVVFAIGPFSTIG